MDPVVLVLTRDENVGDKIEFSIKKDIPIRFVKKLLEAKLPYHPDVQNIEIFFDQQLQSDDVMVYSLVSDKVLDMMYRKKNLIIQLISRFMIINHTKNGCLHQDRQIQFLKN